jgi:hypothetical protein
VRRKTLFASKEAPAGARVRVQVRVAALSLAALRPATAVTRERLSATFVVSSELPPSELRLPPSRRLE